MALSRAGLAKAVSGAFKAVGDVAQAATLRRKATTYNTASGTVTVVTTDYAITKAVQGKWENFEVDKIYILATDTKIIFQSSEIPVTPSISTDQFVWDSKTYNIVRVTKDPAEVLWILQLRAPN